MLAILFSALNAACGRVTMTSNRSVDSYRAARRADDDAPRGALPVRAGHLKR